MVACDLEAVVASCLGCLVEASYLDILEEASYFVMTSCLGVLLVAS